MNQAVDLRDLAARDWDAVVIGAGPAGAIAALELARAGRGVLLIDRARFPRAKVCGGCLNANALRMLRQASIEDRIWNAGAVHIGEFVLSANGRSANVELPGGAAISRAALDDLLATAAREAGAVFLEGVSATISRITDDSATIVLHTPDQSATLRASACLVATGLAADAHKSLDISVQVSRGSRVGCSAMFPDESAVFLAGCIHMAVHRAGYVGLTRVERGMLNVAAAVDARFLRESGSPAAAVHAVLHDAGLPSPAGIADAAWRGTPPLTRRASPVARGRWLFIGDAAGYVEPFTGEGIAWALESGRAAARFVHRSLHAWDATVAQAWEREHARIVARAQTRCRAVSLALRRPRLVRAAIAMIRIAPAIARPFVYSLTTPTHTEEFAP